MKIAFLEDNKSFAEDIVGYLSLAGHEVHHFFTGRDCLKALVNDKYDMCLFDWEVPDMSGSEVLTNLKLKGSVTPVIFLTGRDSEEDIVQVMEAGADDYIVKPPSNNILNARINALYRRANPNKAQLESVNYGHLSVDFANRRFIINQLPVKLTEKETDLALYFFKHLDVLLSRGHLTKVVWGTTPDLDTRTIDVHVSHLRNKLNLLPQFGWRLISVYHQGYRLERLV